LRREEEEQLLESLGRVEAYRPVFQQYAGYENRVLPGTITALGEIDTSEVRSLPSKNILMVGVQGQGVRGALAGVQGAGFIQPPDTVVRR
jgi:hypothetical protein